MTNQPLVSIIVPSYNQGQFIAETIESIVAQDYRPLEILVVDGASTDDTVAILRQLAGQHPEIQWWSEKDDGIVDAVNKGLQRAHGSIAGIQSSDDLYRPGAIAQAVGVLESRPELGLVCADAEIIDQAGRIDGIANYPAPFTPARFLARTTVIHQSSAFFRRQAALEVGGWNNRYFCCDADMWLRMMFRVGVVHVDAVWSAWRRHPDQRNEATRQMWRDWARMTKESLDVRRAPLSVRLAAAAGRRLMAIDYNPTKYRWFQSLQISLALLIYPPSVNGVPAKLLPPGVGRLLRGRQRRLSLADAAPKL